MGVSLRAVNVNEAKAINADEATYPELLRNGLTLGQMLDTVIDKDSYDGNALIARYFVEEVIETGEFIYRVNMQSGLMAFARGQKS